MQPFRSGIREVEIMLSTSHAHTKFRVEITVYTHSNGAVRVVEERQSMHRAVDDATAKVRHCDDYSVSRCCHSSGLHLGVKGHVGSSLVSGLCLFYICVYV